MRTVCDLGVGSTLTRPPPTLEKGRVSRMNPNGGAMWHKKVGKSGDDLTITIPHSS